MIVCVNFKGGTPSKLKRLVGDPPQPPRAADEVEFMWVLEMDNPWGRFFIPQEDVESVHVVAGVVRTGNFIPLQ